MTDSHLSNTRFDTLPLHPSLLDALSDLGYDLCTPIQAEALPITLAGKDIMGQAQTGTGKTATFLLSTMQRLLEIPASDKRRPNQPRALIIAPTRELALQIQRDAEELGKHSGLTSTVIYGGTGYQSQQDQITEGVDILIGTPGRTIDYFKQKIFDLKAIEVVVLDEADRMFDLGFIKDIRFLLRRCPDHDKRLSMLFSATMPLRVTELAYEHMNNPQLVSIETQQVTAKQIEEAVYFPANDEKIPLLLGLLEKHQPSQSIIFVNTKRSAERVTAFLRGNNHKAEMLSGDVPQKKRQRILEEFTNGSLPILVATDVAARGLHIPNVSHVFNYDLPQDCEDYVHRIGRTGRAGASGVAISLACEEYSFYQPEIEEYIGHKIPYEPISSELLIKPLPPEKIQRRPRPHGKGGKPSGSGNRNRRHHNKKPSSNS